MPNFFSSTDLTLPVGGAFRDGLAREFFLADMNGDGNLDLVITYEAYPVQNRAIPIRVLLGDGRGGFSGPSDGTSPVFGGGLGPAMVDPRAHVLADFNGDGRPDLFIADTGYDASPYPGASNTLILSGPGGTYLNGAANLPALKGYNIATAAGDIDRDRDQDLIVSDRQRGVYFLINDGTGHFSVDQSRLPAGFSDPNNGIYPSALLFDANGDGFPDLFLGSDGATQFSTSKILLNDGTGHFNTVASAFAPPGAYQTFVVDAASADVNGDGKPDLVLTLATGGYAHGEVQILINQGAGVFADETAQRIYGESGPLSGPVMRSWIYRTILADVNRDGYPDMVLMTSGGTAGSPVLLNDGTGHFIRMPGLLPGLSDFDRLAVGDINGDGRTDFVAWRSNYEGVEQLRVYLGTDPGANLTGTPGPDGFMIGPGPHTVDGGAGDDVIFGGPANDYLRGGDGNDFIVGGGGDDDINGNKGNDTIHGGDGNDWVLGGQGNDLLFGDAGNDLVYGNLGNDTLNGGAGNDTLRGGQGDDSISGGPGDDWISGDRGNDTMTGGPGADTFHTFAQAGMDLVLDFNRAEGDRVQLDPGTVYTVSQVGADVVIDMGGGNQMVLANVQLSSLTPGWIFEL